MKLAKISHFGNGNEWDMTVNQLLTQEADCCSGRVTMMKEKQDNLQFVSFEVGPKAMGSSRRTSSPAAISRVARRHLPRSSGHVWTRYNGGGGSDKDDIVERLGCCRGRFIE